MFSHKDRCKATLKYYLAPIYSWKSHGDISVKIYYPKNWKISKQIEKIHLDKTVFTVRKEESGELDFVIKSKIEEEKKPEYLNIGFDSPDARIIWGGPALYLGGTFNYGFTLRADYEIGLDDFIRSFGWAIDKFR